MYFYKLKYSFTGNDILHYLLRQGTYEMRMDMRDFKNQTRYVKYSGFNVGHETSKYNVNLYGYSGIVGKIFLECNEFSFVCSNNLFHLTLISLFKEI